MAVMQSAPAQLDHLVVLAADLASGVRWCERTLGVTPDAGGEHPLMGTHNRLINISSAAHPRAYLEIIALHPGVQPTREAGKKRWFDMDDPRLMQRVATSGPQLIHWVASVPDLAASHAAWQALDIDRGRMLQASRPTAQGLLEWQITVRDDGQRLFDGCLPTLIEWGAAHPCAHLPARGVQLQHLQIAHAQAAPLQAALAVAHIPDAHIDVAFSDAPALRAQLSTPKGMVELL
ncbi:VOC family protein [Diaphorobacter sp.]|uniref:VOC family protein n=1 Tax=Diaphorobacter sp. TaxID=1934310 RepID=UPI0039185ADB